MKTECPYCHQHYEVENSFVGNFADCQSCGKQFEITPSVIDAKDLYTTKEKKRKVRWYHWLIIILGLYISVFGVIFGIVEKEGVPAAMLIGVGLLIVFMPFCKRS